MEAVIATLAEAQVGLLVDVREAPISRRPEFAKSALARALADAAIAYRHEPRLGAPKPLRDQVKGDRDYQRFFAAYAEHLACHEEAVVSLAGEATAGVALLCYERDHRVCHRRLVADAVAHHVGITPQHLQPPRRR